jgi:hypothetical protein
MTINVLLCGVNLLSFVSVVDVLFFFPCNIGWWLDRGGIYELMKQKTTKVRFD